MNGLVGNQAQAAEAADVAQLQETFRVFTQATKNLESAYSRLEVRAAGVDVRLQEANDRLRTKVGELKTVTGELNGILDAIPCGVVASHADGTISRLNPAAERIIGRPAAEIVGRDARTLLDHQGRHILLLGSPGVAVGQNVERSVCGLDGSARFLSGSLAALPGGGRLEVLSDQTEVQHLRAQVTRLDTLAELGEMAAGVAHEIRNPMNAVSGFAGLLEKSVRADKSEPPQLLRYADRIRRGAAEVNGIIANLLMWARPERAASAPVNLLGLMKDVTTDYQASREGGHAVLEVMPFDEEIHTCGDHMKLKLAVQNLVRNAEQAAGPDGLVRIQARAGGGRVIIMVEDNGPGIAPEMRARLFRPFATDKASGTGLGLALVRKFVELHGGSVAVDRSALGGARFTLALPQFSESEGGS